MLSRTPHRDATNKTDEENISPDINENAYEINTINSNAFNPKTFASCEVEEADLPDRETFTNNDLSMREEQTKDEKICQIKKQIESGAAGANIQSKFIIIDDVVYYISKPDSDTVIRLYVPEHLRESIVVQYHDSNGHLGIDKTYDSIRQKYYWPNLYKQLYSYITTCVTCQARNLRKTNPLVQETDIPPYPFAKIAIDLSGPYPETLSGNKYIIGFIDHFSGYPEAFAVKDKKAETIAHLLIEEIIPRHSVPLQILSDNGSENVNRVMKKTCKALNISHVTTSFYHPQSNGRIERFHKTLHDILSKLMKDDTKTWDLYLNQALAAIRFNISESSKFSPFYLLYNRDAVLPVDNLMKPHRKYVGEDMHKIMLNQQHKAFLLVHRSLKQAKKRQMKYKNRNSTEERLQVGDPVYYKNHLRKNKLENRWTPYYRIIDQTSPVSFIIKNQLTGTTTKAHAEHLRFAKIDIWDIPKDNNNKRLRKTTYVAPPDSSTEMEVDSDSDSEYNIPLAKLVEKNRKERDNSSGKEAIPLMELSKLLKEKERKENAMSYSTDSSSSEEPMSENEVVKTKFKTRKVGRKFSPKSDNNSGIKTLLMSISNIL